MAHGSGPHLLAELSFDATTHSSAPVGSDAATCPMALALPPREKSSGAATCSSSLDLASLPMWALALPRGPGLTSPRGELRCCHIPHGPQQAVDHRNKEGPSCPRYAAGLACVQSTVVCYRGACKVCGQAATVRFNSATLSQLTTPEHGYSGDIT
jgi:hypothetical protein